MGRLPELTLQLPTLLATVAAVYLATGVVIAARRRPSYRHARHTISELGEQGAAHALAVAYGLFLPTAALTAFAGLLLLEAHAAVAGLAFAIAVGYGLSVVFPCDPGSPLAGSARQGMHNLGGAVQYLGGTLALFVISESMGAGFRIAGFVVGAATLAVSFENPLRGAVQRVAELTLFLGLISAAYLAG